MEKAAITVATKLKNDSSQFDAILKEIKSNKSKSKKLVFYFKLNHINLAQYIDVTADVEQLPNLIQIFISSYGILGKELTKFENAYDTYINDNIPSEPKETVGMTKCIKYFFKNISK